MSHPPHTTLRAVEVAPRRLDDYRGIAPDGVLEETIRQAAMIDGARVLHISTASYGGGVPELVASEVALLRDVGVDAEWQVICPDEEFSGVTRRIHNAMQRHAALLGPQDRAAYLNHNHYCAAMVGHEWDVIVVHDAEAAALIAEASADAAWIWRCHIDTSTPNPAAWDLIRLFILGYDAFVFAMPEFCPPGLDRERLTVIAPAIDPLTAKNRWLPRHLTQRVVEGHGIDVGRPLVVQVSSLGCLEDPLGVVEAWRSAKEAVPGTQLALIGSIAEDDPEGWRIYDHLREETAGEPDCYIRATLTGMGPLEVNAFQREADVIVQSSLREGFGLPVSEALWKYRPVIGGNAGGIPLQIGADGGLIVNDADECGEAMVRLLHDEALGAHLARAGHERVRHAFLTPRLVCDDVRLYAEALGSVTREAGVPTPG